MRRLATATGSVLLCACVAPQPNAAPAGPTLVIDVRNASDRALEVEYDFTSGVTSGTGGTFVEPCQRHPWSVGDVGGGGGTYRIEVDGDTVVDATIPASAPEGASIVVSVLVGQDGAVEVLPPSMVEVPELDTTTIPGCG
jgi:hypothetical protein